MTIFFVILVIVCCVILGFVVLVQNPKGGGLAANIGGLSNQFMGVKQTTDVLEKGTWIFAALVALLCLFSAAFMPGPDSGGGRLMDKVNTKPATTTTPVTPNPGNTTPGQR
jgi:preprotein translocase subunit SecG